MVDNREISVILYEIADYLELQGVAFKPQAYRKAARSIEVLDGTVEGFSNDNRLNEIEGIGKAIAEKIEEILKTGKLRYLEELRAQIPAGVLELLEVPDIGPKKAMFLHNELGIESIEDLKAAIFSHKLSGLKGFGIKTEDRILQGIRIHESRAGRILLGEAYSTASDLISRLESEKSVIKISIAGSLRRMRETIGDIDLLVASSEPEELMNAFVSLSGVQEIIVKGKTKTSVRLFNGIQVDLRVVEEACYGAAMQYFTGSQEHNVEIRKFAISKDMKISEYGLFKRDSNEIIVGDDEEKVYNALGLQYIPPALRENRGEVEAAKNGTLPDLIGYDDLRGEFHCHTESSDAMGTIKEIWEAASRLGYEYVGIADHSQSLRIANGLSESRLSDQTAEIWRLRESLGPPLLLSGSEVDVLGDGRLDYPNKVLNDLDFAIMSIHSKFNLDRKQMTERIVTAMSNEAIRIFAHPTGRIIGQRNPYEFDFEKVVDAAVQNGVSLEINSFPERLDLNDVNTKRAINAGAKISINSDAHTPPQLEYVRFGIATARRGWAEKSDVVNSKSIDEIERYWGLK